MYVKSNTGSNQNGWVQIKINDTPLLDQAIRWTTNDSQRLINKLSFNTFRGGNGTQWESPNTDYIYFDNLVVNKIAWKSRISHNDRNYQYGWNIDTKYFILFSLK